MIGLVCIYGFDEGFPAAGLITHPQGLVFRPGLEKCSKRLSRLDVWYGQSFALLGGLNRLGEHAIVVDARGFGSLGEHRAQCSGTQFCRFFDQEMHGGFLERRKGQGELWMRYLWAHLTFEHQRAILSAGTGNLSRPFTIGPIEQQNFGTRFQSQHVAQIMSWVTFKRHRMVGNEGGVNIQTGRRATHDFAIIRRLVVASTAQATYIAAMSDVSNTSAENSGASDIPVGNWVDKYVPGPARPYMRLARLDRPIGTWLLLLPCWWGLALASPGWPDWKMGLLFAVGALVMRGAGCTLNDLADRRMDAKVARTADRPIASGEISVVAGLVFIALLSALGLWILLQFNAFAIKLGAASLVLVVIYPFMKRVTYWPQLWLGLTFNWGALMGWAVVHGDLGAAPGWLYAAGILWTLGYDTIYAHQDKEDDMLVGVKSSALALGRNTKPWLVVFYSGALVLIGVAGWTIGLIWPFYAGLAVGGLHLAWQVWAVNIDNASDCMGKFQSNRDFGLLITAGIIASQVLAG